MHTFMTTATVKMPKGTIPHHNAIERHQEYARRIASRHVTKQGEPHGVVLIQAAMLEAQ